MRPGIVTVLCSLLQQMLLGIAMVCGLGTCTSCRVVYLVLAAADTALRIASHMFNCYDVLTLGKLLSLLSTLLHMP